MQEAWCPAAHVQPCARSGAPADALSWRWRHVSTFRQRHAALRKSCYATNAHRSTFQFRQRAIVWRFQILLHLLQRLGTFLAFLSSLKNVLNAARECMAVVHFLERLERFIYNYYSTIQLCFLVILSDLRNILLMILGINFNVFCTLVRFAISIISFLIILHIYRK